MDRSKIRVLLITSGFRKGVSGGIPSVLHNYCSTPVFENDFHFEYLSLGYQTFEPYRRDLEKNGGALHCLNIHSVGLKRNLEIFRILQKFLKDHCNEYDIIHINSGALTQVLVCAMAARKATDAAIIVHSHNAVEKPFSRRMLYSLIKPLFYRAADMYFACSEMAAQSMFPAKVLKEKSWKLIYNAIDTQKFAFDVKTREVYRNKLGLSDRYVIGNVGRFNEQKNHRFLIHAFHKVVEHDSEATLVLVGTGELEEEIKGMANSLGLGDRVLFLGQRSDVNNIMQAMDCLAFPSLYEGLGMVLIEAQTAGLRVVSSDRVPIQETKITDQISYLPLDANLWAEEILKNKVYSRQDNAGVVSEAGYDLVSAAMKLRDHYMQLIQR